MIFIGCVNWVYIKCKSWMLFDVLGELEVSMSSGEEDSESSQESNVLGRFAVASVLLFVYTLVAGDLRLSAVFFTSAIYVSRSSRVTCQFLPSL